MDLILKNPHLIASKFNSSHEIENFSGVFVALIYGHPRCASFCKRLDFFHHEIKTQLECLALLLGFSLAFLFPILDLVPTATEFQARFSKSMGIESENLRNGLELLDFVTKGIKRDSMEFFIMKMGFDELIDIAHELLGDFFNQLLAFGKNLISTQGKALEQFVLNSDAHLRLDNLFAHRINTCS